MRKPIPVSELLAQGKAKLERLRKGSDEAARALLAVQEVLEPDLAEHVWSAALKPDGTLTVVVDGAGWATRLRYAAPDLGARIAAALGHAVGRVIVRVRPRPA